VLPRFLLLALLCLPAAAAAAPAKEPDGIREWTESLRPRLRPAAEEDLRREVVARLALQGTHLLPDELQVSELWAPSLRFTFGFRARAPGTKIYGTGHLELVRSGERAGLLELRHLDLHQKSTVFGFIGQRLGALGRRLGAVGRAIKRPARVSLLGGGATTIGALSKTR
jgi:hypothetical protein